jgi:hypothetical protein
LNLPRMRMRFTATHLAMVTLMDYEELRPSTAA